MKKLCSIIFLSVSSALAAPLTKGELNHAFKKLEINIPIRVLLDEKSAREVQWKLRSSGPFIVYSPHNKTKTVFQSHELEFRVRNGAFYCNGVKQIGNHLFIVPLKGLTQFKKDIFDGIFAVTLLDGTAYLVNHLDLEDYVLAVLPYESWPGWPDEVQKAFCIVFRSYGIAKVLEQRTIHEKSGRAVPYDIKNTTAHQVYKGCSKCARFEPIVKETQGIVLAHKNKPILAMFDVACGGIVPSRKAGIHFAKAPYLHRSYPCHYCKDYKYYRWQKEFRLDDIEKVLRSAYPDFGKLKDIVILSHDQAGVAQDIKVKGTKRSFTLPASKLKSLLKEVRSLCFTFERHGRTLTIVGKGHGHHMGLCQRGTYAMVKQGWQYKQILKFYYPHTTFMKLKKIAY